MVPVHLMQAVGVECEANNLVNQPFFVLSDQKLTELILKLWHKILVDLPNHGFDGGHSGTSLGVCETPNREFHP